MYQQGAGSSSSSSSQSQSQTQSQPHSQSQSQSQPQPQIMATSNTTAVLQLTRYSSAPSSVFDSFNIIEESIGLTMPNQHQQYYQQQYDAAGTGSSYGGNNILIRDHHPSRQISNDVVYGPDKDHQINMMTTTTTTTTTTRRPDQSGDGHHIAGAAGMVSNINTSQAAPAPTRFPASNNNLTRHSSSPAGFLTHLASDIGFSLTRGRTSEGRLNSASHRMMSTNKSKLVSDRLIIDINSEIDGHQETSNYNGFSISSWEDDEDYIYSTTSRHSSKRATHLDPALLSAIESQTGSEMIGSFNNIPEDSVPCKLRAKRGFATHPRSIAERERRTRISGKLRALQELIPNTDKQTSHSEALDQAVQYIKGLLDQIQKLNKELEKCTCGSKRKRR